MNRDKSIEQKKEDLISSLHFGMKIAGIIGWILILGFIILIILVFILK